MRYSIYEGYMEALRKKVATIQKKCARYGCDFQYAEVGEEIVMVRDGVDRTGKPRMVPCRYVIVEVEGTAQVPGWKFVASVEHTEKGNIFSKAMTDIEIPERYRTGDTYCEHCGTRRRRNGTFLIVDEEGNFKQVGHNCLMDYTHGMSASWAAYMASLRSAFEEEESRPVSGVGYHERMYLMEEIARYTAETIRHFGYKRDGAGATRERVQDFYAVRQGDTRLWHPDVVAKITGMMEEVGFDPESPEATSMAAKALAWIGQQEEKNDYFHNLKVVTSLQYISYGKFGLLVSLFPTWNRELEWEAKRRAEAEAGKQSEHVGAVGDRITVEIADVKCISSWETMYGITYVWKITGADGNIYTWKTGTFLSEEKPPKGLKGTVKEHKEFRGVKQTELTRCKKM